MKKMVFTYDDVKAVYDEVERRLQMEIDDALADGINVTPKMIKGLREDMLQGVYSTLMVLALNWSDVVCYMIEKIEDELHWKDLGYEGD